jgi:ComF family protein
VRPFDLLFPPHCTLCDRDIEPDTADRSKASDASPPEYSPLDVSLCRECVLELTPPSRFACRRCGSTLQAPPERPWCPRCRGVKTRFTETIAFGEYDGLLRQAVLGMKRDAWGTTASAVAELFLLRSRREFIELEPEAIIPVPMHWARRIVRGVNSPEVFAESLGRSLKLPVLIGALRRTRWTKRQAKLPPAARLQNVENAFKASRPEDIRGRRILLVDDILTTGATCNEAARVLKKAGATQVAVAVFAKAEPNKNK